jgi:hypothetical protein
LVHCETPFDVATDFNGNPLDSGKPTIRAVAISRSGVLEKCNSMRELLEMLDAKFIR